ncbi:peptidoglycan DD-metalloendopeptidase family protein [Alphaproteobacteria bacterium KMM 3653]|uniref:Peptidoglycan DD-metalloendopeptidase family protein n=1 Tax=Harenicola maris TaxID=2841044 RepID=A0AAP2CNG6_9RHOB|nr:peptidoglycan DD-metalloendopeptidase family protein [Harenicola maris]
MGHSNRLLSLCLATSFVGLAACSDFDLDLRDVGRGFDTSDAVKVQAEPRPKADDRGILSYPNYQVAVARRGDTVTDVANRIGLPVDELARYNGVPVDAKLNRGELLALPRRVEEPSPATGASITGPIRPTETVDVTALASNAIDRAEPARTAPSGTSGQEPTRHQVKRGETAYSVARLYNVSPKSLADWNGLGSDLSIREGQYLLIPVAAAAIPEPAIEEDTSAPGQGSTTPTPPSAAAPLPDETPERTAATTTTTGAPAPAAGTPPSPELAAQATSASSSAALARPADGNVIRDFQKGKNDGIDIGASAGAPVRAADAGTVAAITTDTDQVPIIVVRHSGGLLTVYANVDGVKVKKGDRVKRGQTIAAVRAGSPSFLHFEVRKGLEAVDPASYLN